MHARSRSTAVFDDLAHGVTDQSEAFLRPRTPTRRHSRQSSFHAQYLEVSEKAPILWNGPENEREELSHEGYDSKSKTFTGRRLTLLWALSLVVTCLGSVFLTRAAYRTQGGGFERGYATDLGEIAVMFYDLVAPADMSYKSGCSLGHPGFHTTVSWQPRLPRQTLHNPRRRSKQQVRRIDSVGRRRMGQAFKTPLLSPE